VGFSEAGKPASLLPAAVVYLAGNPGIK